MRSGRVLRGHGTTVLLTLGVAGALLSGCAHAAPAPTVSTAISPTPTTTTVGCVTYTSEGEQVWTHPYVGDQRDIAAPLEEIANAHPDEVAGTAFCSDYVGLAIFVKDGSRQVLDEIDALERRLPTARIDVHEVPHSLNEMLHFMDLVDTDSAPMIRGLHPNIYTGGLTIWIADSADETNARELVRESVGDIPVSIRLSTGTSTPARFG